MKRNQTTRFRTVAFEVGDVGCGSIGSTVSADRNPEFQLSRRSSQLRCLIPFRPSVVRRCSVRSSWQATAVLSERDQPEQRTPASPRPRR